MAKRRKEKDEEEDKPFKMPKFDEKKFLTKEKRNIKVTFLSALFGIFLSLLCFGFYALMGPETPARWYLLLMVAIANAAFLKYIFIKLNIDLSDFTNKNWFSALATYFFVWLILLIVLVNPPIHDEESPLVDLVVLPKMQEYGGTINIYAKITDNAGIEKSGISLEINDETIPQSQYEFKNNIFTYIHQSPVASEQDQTFEYTLTIEDISGLETQKTGSFTYSEDVISLVDPDAGSEIEAVDDIKIRVNAKINRVYYTVNDGHPINATIDPSRENYYVSNAEYKGWPAEKNKTVTVKVYAEKAYYFENYLENDKFVKFNNTIMDNTSYIFKIGDDTTDIGEKDLITVDMPEGKFVSAPGFEAIVFIISLVTLALIFKYKKKNQKNKK